MAMALAELQVTMSNTFFTKTKPPYERTPLHHANIKSITSGKSMIRRTTFHSHRNLASKHICKVQVRASSEEENAALKVGENANVEDHFVCKEVKGVLESGKHLMLVHKEEDKNKCNLVSSAMAVAKSLQKTCSCKVEFTQRIEKTPSNIFSCPSPEFTSLCNEQLALCAALVGRDALYSVYVRPAGSYVTDQLELRRVVMHPNIEPMEENDMLVLSATFGTKASLRIAEVAFSKHEIEDIPEHNAFVVPMIKDLFLVGLLVAERFSMQSEKILPPPDDDDISLNSSHPNTDLAVPSFTVEQKTNAVRIARTLAVAYVIDQKALLLQQTSWQKGIRMSNLMEQMHGPLSTIRTLSKMLLPHLKGSEIPHDVLEDILVQGDQMKALLQQLQDVFYYTKANLMHLWEGDLNKVQTDLLTHFPQQSSTMLTSYTHPKADLEVPMPPLALIAPENDDVRPCNVSKLLSELVNAGNAVAQCQKQSLQLRQGTSVLFAAIDEDALRQAVSNILDSALLRVPAGGWVKVEATEAPGGGVLVVIDDNGPDMTLMTQVHSLAPFETQPSKVREEDNIAWNFVAGIVIAREILEQYGSVLRILSPCLPNAQLGEGGTHIEIWLPAI